MAKVFSDKRKLNTSVEISWLKYTIVVAFVEWNGEIREEPDNVALGHSGPNKVNISGLFVSLGGENAEIPNQLRISTVSALRMLLTNFTATTY